LAFVKYNTVGCKEQVRDLLRKRLKLKDDIRRHKKKIQYHLDKIEETESVELVKVEERLNFYLDRAKE